MATQSRAEGKPSPKVQKAIERLWEAYEVGKQITENCPMGGRYGAGLIDGEARRHGINPDTARKLRQFVDPKQGFTDSELKDLIALSGQHDYPLAISTVFRLFPVPKRGGERKQFIRELISGRWKRARVAAEIRRRYESQRPGDHVPRIADDFNDASVELQNRAFQFRRWCVEFVEARRQKAGSRGAQRAQRAVEAVLDAIRDAVQARADVPNVP